jgi:thymidylate synthase
MNPTLIKGFSIPDAYFELNKAIWEKGVEWMREGTPKERTKALLNVVLHITNPEVRPLAHPEAPLSEDFITTYAYTRLITPEKETDETYTYGERLRRIGFGGTTIDFDQIAIASEILKRSPETRRCVMVIARPDDLVSEDPPCMREINLWLEQPDFKRMHMSVFFRSWDTYKAANANLGALQLMQEEIASTLNVKTGTITVFATNAHIYEKDFPFVKKWLDKKVGLIKRF